MTSHSTEPYRSVTGSAWPRALASNLSVDVAAESPNVKRTPGAASRRTESFATVIVPILSGSESLLLV
jgi:hypothetical protein